MAKVYRGKNGELINAKDITPKGYKRTIRFFWFLAIVGSFILAYLTISAIENPVYVSENGYDVLAKETWLRIIFFPLGILLLCLFASIITAKNKLKIARYIKRYLDALPKKVERPKVEPVKLEPIIIPEAEELEEDDSEDEALRSFFEQNELSDIKALFKGYLENHSIVLEEKVVNEIFSSIASSRLIFVKGATPENSRRLTEILNGFFMGNGYYDIIEETDEAMTEEAINDKNLRFYNFLKSCKKRNTLHFANFICRTPSLFIQNYVDFIPALLTAEGYIDYTVFNKFEEDAKFTFPSSIWCVISCDEITEIPLEISKSCLFLNLTGVEFASYLTAQTEDAPDFGGPIFAPQTEQEPVEEFSEQEDESAVTEETAEEVTQEDEAEEQPAEYGETEPQTEFAPEEYQEPNYTEEYQQEEPVMELIPITPNEEKPVSYMRFKEMINEEIGQYSLSLENWKKLDLLEAYIEKANKNYFNNKVCRQLERYVAFEMSGGATEMQALDKALANKILPFLINIPKENYAEEDERIPEFINRVFGLQNLPICELALTEYSALFDTANN